MDAEQEGGIQMESQLLFHSFYIKKTLNHPKTHDRSVRIKQTSHRNHTSKSVLVLVSSVSAELAVAGNLDTRDLDVHSRQHISSLLININLILLKSRHGGDVVKTTLSLLLLKLQRDSAHRSTLNSLHQVLSIIRFT